MNVNLIIGIVAGAAMVALVGGALLYKRWRIAHLPRSWSHTGTKPKNADAGIEIVRQELAALGYDVSRWGGECEWVDQPFFVQTLGLWCDGIVVNGEIPHFKLVTRERLEDTAFTHEDIHVVFDVGDTGRTEAGIATLPPYALTIVNNINAKVKAQT